MPKLAKTRGDKQAGPGGSYKREDPLAAAIATFARGDYARAKRALAEKMNDAELSEGQREQARELYAATGLERGTLWVGIACVGLLVLVLIVTALTQPVV